MSANWFEDGQHILVLFTGAIAVGVQALTLWHSMRVGAQVEAVSELVTTTTDDLQDELKIAQTSLGHIANMIGPDRRRLRGMLPGGLRKTDPPLLTHP